MILYQTRMSVAPPAVAYMRKVAQAAGVATLEELMQLAVIERAKQAGVNVPDQERATTQQIERAFAHDKSRILMDERISEADGLEPMALTVSVESRDNNWFQIFLKKAGNDLDSLLIESIVAYASKYGIPPPL